MVRIARRKELARKGKMGCPRTDPPKYPLDTRKRTLNAMQRYKQAGTTKCPEFWGNWCRRAKTVGLSHIETYDKKCK